MSIRLVGGRTEQEIDITDTVALAVWFEEYIAAKLSTQRRAVYVAWMPYPRSMPDHRIASCSSDSQTMF